MNYRIFFIRLKKIIITITNLKLLKIFIKYRVIGSFEHNHLFKFKFSFIIDVGAHNGQFAIAARHFSNANIVSFEPQDDAANIFSEIFKNDGNVSLHKIAIGQKQGKKQINISAKSDSSSILEIGKNQEKYFPGTHMIETSNIDIEPLDKVLKSKNIMSPALLKIDVQGYEMEVLKGSKDILPNFTYIYCECSFIELYKNQALASDIISFLNNFHFKLIGTYNVDIMRNGECIQADLLFKRIIT